MDVLQRLQPVSDRYATAPVAEAFTWDDAGGDLGNGEWYLVAFRSVRRPSADEARLWEIDELAHQEAAGSPGFVHYFKDPSPPTARAFRSASGIPGPTPGLPRDGRRTFVRSGSSRRCTSRTRSSSIAWPDGPARR